MGRGTSFRACALWLLLLAASPLTFPFMTYDVSSDHQSTPATDTSVKLKPPTETSAALSTAAVRVIPVLGELRSGAYAQGSAFVLHPPISLVLRI
jgi:hypothetical protein